jgi:hypothetical protein
MPEVLKTVPEHLRPVLDEAFAKAREGSLSPHQLLAILEENNIHGIQKLLYAHQALNLSLERLKEIEQSRGRGFTDSDVEQLAEALAQLNKPEA